MEVVGENNSRGIYWTGKATSSGFIATSFISS
jgi:hypothetical protein